MKHTSQLPEHPALVYFPALYKRSALSTLAAGDTRCSAIKHSSV